MKTRKSFKSIVTLALALTLSSALFIPAHAYVSEYDQQYLNSNQMTTVKDATEAYAAAQDAYMNASNAAEAAAAAAAMAAAHAAAEAARAASDGNYSGGTSGDKYIPNTSGGSSGGGSEIYVPPYVPPAASITATGVTLYNQNNVANFTTFKAGYGFSASIELSMSNNPTITSAYATMSNGKTCNMELVDGKLQFVKNSSSPTQQRRYYVPVTTADGTFTVTFTINANDPNYGALPTITKTVTFQIKGTMYDDDHTGGA